MVVIRKGAALYPRLTLVLGALAVAAIDNLGMQLFHFRHASIMILFWHLALLAGCLGRHVLGWRRAAALF